MDFSWEYQYTKEQEAFRDEVRRWLDENVPKALPRPRDPLKLPYETWKKMRELGRKLGQKGWLFPTYPRQYGGGGLDAVRTHILREELAARQVGLPPYFDCGVLTAASLMACGTEDQKRRLLPPVLTGESFAWQLFTEPEAGTDEANQRTNALRAVREKDHFIVNGQKIFVGGLYPPPDAFLLLTRSDLEAPRHENLAMFIAPANLPGVTIRPLDLFVPSTFGSITGPAVDGAQPIKYTVFFDDARIPDSYLIGGEKDGWKVATAALNVEHGGGEPGVRAVGRYQNVLVERFLAQCNSNPQVVKRLKENPHLLDSVVNVYIGDQIERLLTLRNAAGKGGHYGGPQLGLYTKLLAPRLMAEITKVLGPYTLTDDPELAPGDGIFEVGHRGAVCFAPGGTPEAQKILIARGLSIGR